jgi:hypothetical protein
MNKYFAISTIGYAIIIVIVLAIAMIISTPMLFNDLNKKDKDENPIQNPISNQIQSPVQNQFQGEDNTKIQEVEERLSSRINELEQVVSSKDARNKYICTMEGNLDENGIVVPLDSSSDRKIVFVCEYRK